MHLYWEAEIAYFFIDLFISLTGIIAAYFFFASFKRDKTVQSLFMSGGFFIIALSAMIASLDMDANNLINISKIGWSVGYVFILCGLMDKGKLVTNYLVLPVLVYPPAVFLSSFIALKALFNYRRHKYPFYLILGFSFILLFLSESSVYLPYPAEQLKILGYFLKLFGFLGVMFAVWSLVRYKIKDRMVFTFLILSVIMVLFISFLYAHFLGNNVLILKSYFFVCLLSSLVSLLIAIVFGEKVAKTLVKPIEVLNLGASEFKNGHLEFQVQVDSKDELSELANSFNIMAKAIKNNRGDLEKKLVELEEKDRLRTEFLRNVSHELRTPLTVIVGYTGLVLSQLSKQLNEKQLNYIRSAYEQSVALQQLINNILEYSSMEKKEIKIFPKVFDLSEVKEDLLKKFGPLAKSRGIEMVIDIPSVKVKADPEKIKQVFSHLVGNALKFTAKDGKVGVFIGEKDDSWVTVKVMDTGIGISEDKIGIIFETFRQGDGSATREYGGTGLGLALAKRLVEMHNGEIRVESEVEKGSIFMFTVPRWQEESSISAEPVIQVTSDNGGKLVLIVEDEKPIADLLKTYLKESGYSVGVVYNGKEAIRQAQILKPFLITLDTTLPDINGWKILNNLKKIPATAHIPIVIISVEDKKGYGLKLGASDYIVKPVEKDKLIEILKSIEGNV